MSRSIPTDQIQVVFLSQNKWKVEAQATALKSYGKCENLVINNKIESLFERLSKKPSTGKKALEILHENISYLQKELTSKDGIIKTLIVTQTSVLESVSYQKLNSESNELVNQFSNEIKNSKSPSSPHLSSSTPHYHQNVNTNTSEENKNSFETNMNVPESENQQSQAGNKKQTFVGNLRNGLNIKD